MSVYTNHRKPWTQEERRALGRLADDFVNMQSPRFGRSPFAIQLQMLRHFGVPQKVVAKMVRRREHGRWAKLWDLLNTQIIGGFIAGIAVFWLTAR